MTYPEVAALCVVLSLTAFVIGFVSGWYKGYGDRPGCMCYLSDKDRDLINGVRSGKVRIAKPRKKGAR
jgi:hypothetical protein